MRNFTDKLHTRLDIRHCVIQANLILNYTDSVNYYTRNLNQWELNSDLNSIHWFWRTHFGHSHFNLNYIKSDKMKLNFMILQLIYIGLLTVHWSPIFGVYQKEAVTGYQLRRPIFRSLASRVPIKFISHTFGNR